MHGWDCSSTGLFPEGAKKVIDNQLCLGEKVDALSARWRARSTARAPRLSRVAASKGRAAEAASAAQASAAVAGGAEERSPGCGAGAASPEADAGADAGAEMAAIRASQDAGGCAIV